MFCGVDSLSHTQQGLVGEPDSPAVGDVHRSSLTRLDLAAANFLCGGGAQLGAFAGRGAIVDPAEYKLRLTCQPESENVKWDTEKSDFLGLATITAPAWEDMERAPIDVICVLDKSSSMGGNPISLLRKSTRRLVKSLGPRDRVCLIEFGSQVNTTLPFTRMDSAGKEKAKKIIKGLVADGMTALCGGLTTALKLAHNRADANDICSILLFTDGEANVGTKDVQGILLEAQAAAGLTTHATPSPPPVDLSGEPGEWSNAQVVQWLKNIQLDLPAYVKTFLDNKIDGDILINDVDKETVSDVLHIGSLHIGKFWRELIRLREPGAAIGDSEGEEGKNKEKEEPTQQGDDETLGKAVITVNTFGFGERHNETLLDKLASEFDGMFFFMKDEATIVESFAACMGGLLSTVAQKMMLSIECKNGATGLEILDKEKDKVITRVAGQKLVFNAGDIQQEESRAILVKFKIPTCLSAEDEHRKYLALELNYENVIASENQALEAPLQVTRTATSTTAQNVEVDAEHNRVLVAAALEQSQKIADATSGSDLSRARRVVTECMQRIKHSVSGKANAKITQDLLKDLRTTLEGLKDRRTYTSWGSKEIRSSGRMMSRQRCISYNTTRHSTQTRYMNKSKNSTLTTYSCLDSDDSDDDTKPFRRSTAPASYTRGVSKKKAGALNLKRKVKKAFGKKKSAPKTHSAPISAPSASLVSAPAPRMGRLDTILSQVALEPVAKAGSDNDSSSDEKENIKASAKSITTL